LIDDVMIAYGVLRTFGQLALRWFYRDIEVVGIERVPKQGPTLLASNHPNALVDALVIGCTLRRAVTLTAKATLLDHPVTRALLRVAGVVPLRRASDHVARAGTDSVLDPTRNTAAFASVLDVLQAGGVVLLFPEGKSHSEPALAPLKTGLARIALMARNERHLHSVPIIPIGLTFERKWEPRSRVLMHIGRPISVDDVTPNVTDRIEKLTHHVDAGLREVTLNFRTTDEARHVLSVSATLAEVLDEFRPLHAPDPPLVDSVQVAQRISRIVPKLTQVDPIISERVARFLGRLTAFEALTQANDIAASDVQMSTRAARGVWFGVRELLIAAVAGPVALWGRVNHWLPLRIARSFAVRTSKTPDEPAMNTIIAGLVLVLIFYVAQVALVSWWLGWIGGLAYAVSLPLSATWDFRYADRVRRGMARVRTYFRFRRDVTLHTQVLGEFTWLRGEAIALNSLVDPVATSTWEDAIHRHA
jgi:1-acyl-sn-glycerol-3-phosphate acyltransferase